MTIGSTTTALAPLQNYSDDALKKELKRRADEREAEAQKKREENWKRLADLAPQLQTLHKAGVLNVGVPRSGYFTDAADVLEELARGEDYYPANIELRLTLQVTEVEH